MDSYLRESLSPQQSQTPKALIAPHAGFIYSGPIAGSAYSCLSKSRDIIKRVVIIGPSHRIGFRGIACSHDDAFRTPMGIVEIDKKAYETISHLPFIITYDQAHRDEHGLEVQLPFLQATLSSFLIVPLVVGDAAGKEVAEVLSSLWGGPETLIVVSSDLSHYLVYDEAVKLDQRTTRSIEMLTPNEIAAHQACGRRPIQGLLMNAAHQHLSVTSLDVRNSGDTAGDKQQVVGYGAYAFG